MIPARIASGWSRSSMPWMRDGLVRRSWTSAREWCRRGDDAPVRAQGRMKMESLADLGIFFGGLGILLLSFAVFWAVSEWRSND